MGWIEHEQELAETSALAYLPIGGFEYLDRVYVATAGPEHGAVMCWQQGLPAGWELSEGDRGARVADNLAGLFAQLALEHDPWDSDGDDGVELREAVEALAAAGDRHARSAADTLRGLVRSAVLDWRSALQAGTLAGQRRLRRLALQRAATADDPALLAELVAQGCDAAEQIRGGLTPVDVALTHGALNAARWLLHQRVPVTNTLRAGAHAVDLGLAGELLSRGATVDASAVSRAVGNTDPAVVDLLARALPYDAGRPAWLISRLRERAARAALVGARGQEGAERERHRAQVLNRTADRLDPAGGP